MATENFTSKKDIIEEFRLSDSDTGSPEVQIALLTKRLEYLAKHFETNKQDKASEVGLLRIVSRRKKLLEYLKREDIDRYRKTIQALGLRK